MGFQRLFKIFVHNCTKFNRHSVIIYRYLTCFRSVASVHPQCSLWFNFTTEATKRTRRTQRPNFILSVTSKCCEALQLIQLFHQHFAHFVKIAAYTKPHYALDAANGVGYKHFFSFIQNIRVYLRFGNLYI